MAGAKKKEDVKIVDSLTKAEIIRAVRDSKCKMLSGLDLEHMTRDEVISHLRESCCPVLRAMC